MKTQFLNLTNKYWNHPHHIDIYIYIGKIKIKMPKAIHSQQIGKMPKVPHGPKVGKMTKVIHNPKMPREQGPK